MIDALARTAAPKSASKNLDEEGKYTRLMELYKGYASLKKLSAGNEKIIPKLKNELAECMAEMWRDEQKTSPKGTRVDALLTSCDDAALVKLVRDKASSGR